MTGPGRTTDKDVDPIRAVHTRAKELERHILEHSRGAEAGDTVAGGHMARGAVKPGSEGGKSKRDKDSQTLTQAVLDQIALIEEQLADLYEQRDVLITKLNEIEQQQAHWAAVQARLSSGEVPAMDDDRRFRDEKLESLVAAYVQRTGRSVDRTDTVAIMSIVDAEQSRLDDAYKDTRNDLEALNKRIDGLEAQAEALQNGRELDAPLDTGLAANADLKSADDVAELGTDHVAAQNGLDQFTF